MANPFAPAQVDIAGGVQNLMQTYQNAQKLQKQQQLETARKTALARLLSGQEQDPVKMIMGYGQATGDLTGMQALAAVYKSTRPPQAAVMSPYQSAQIEHDKVIEAQGADQKYLSGIPSSRKDYWISNPSAAPKRFRDAIGIGDTSGGDTGMPPETTAQPTAQPQAQPQQLSYEKWHAIQTGKMLAPAEAEKHVNLVVSNLDNTRDFATKLLADPNLDKAFGGISNILTRSPSPGAGAGNVLPSWMTAGTGIADVKSAVDSLKDQISLAVIANMKEASGKAGSTGLGRVMQIEYNGWQNALGSLKEAQSPDAVRQSLRNIVSYIDKSKENIQGALSKDYETNQATQAPPPGQSLGVPGMQTINTPPPPGAVPQMDINQITQIARDLAQNQHMNKQQIIEWFAGKGIQLPP